MDSRLRKHRPASAMPAFTLVELLVVIGIISVLIAILLPALNKARESARQVQCLSNMKQLSTAIIQYCNDNKGSLPGRAGADGKEIINPPFKQGVSSTWDWIAWFRVIDPVNGETGKTSHDENITDSALAKYLGSKPIETKTPQESATAALALQSIYRCPSDNLESRPNIASDKPKYRYSYSMNDFYSNPIQQPISGYERDDRYDGKFNGKITSIRKPSDKILLVDEDEATIDDAVFRGNPVNWMNHTSVNAVAARHELQRRQTSGLVFGKGKPTDDARGNVSFWDGHAEFMSRKDAIRQIHTGSPAPDPVGF